MWLCVGMGMGGTPNPPDMRYEGAHERYDETRTRNREGFPPSPTDRRPVPPGIEPRDDHSTERPVFLETVPDRQNPCIGDTSSLIPLPLPPTSF